MTLETLEGAVAQVPDHELRAPGPRDVSLPSIPRNRDVSDSTMFQGSFGAVREVVLSVPSEMSQAAATHFVEASTFLGARGGRARIDEVGSPSTLSKATGPGPPSGH